MSLLFYKTAINKSGEQLEGILATMVPSGNFETYYTIESFISRLLEHEVAEPGIAVLFASTKEDLLNLMLRRCLSCVCWLCLCLTRR